MPPLSLLLFPFFSFLSVAAQAAVLRRGGTLGDVTSTARRSDHVEDQLRRVQCAMCNAQLPEMPFACHVPSPGLLLNCHLQRGLDSSLHLIAPNSN